MGFEPTTLRDLVWVQIPSGARIFSEFSKTFNLSCVCCFIFSHQQIKFLSLILVCFTVSCLPSVSSESDATCREMVPNLSQWQALP